MPTGSRRLLTPMVVLALAGCSPRDHLQSRAGAGPATRSHGDADEDEGADEGAAASVIAPTPAPAKAQRVPIETRDHAFTVRDLIAFDRISDPQVSPDGRRIVFVLRATDPAANRGRTDLWMIPTAGGEPVVLAEHVDADMNPRWSADGRSVFFLSRRSGRAQVWRADADGGGEPQQITTMPIDVGGFLLSPDNANLVLFAEVFPACTTLQCTVDELARREAKKASGMVFDHLFVRHWDAWKDGRRSHLFVVPVAGGEPIDVTAGVDADVPSKPFGGDEEVTFTPDGASLIFAARDVGREEAWSTNFDLYSVPLPTGRQTRAGERRILTEDNPAWDTRPLFSPDGSTLVYLAMSRPGFEADRFRIMARAWPDGETREIAPTWDRSPSELLFSADGETLYATADDLGSHPLFAIDVASGEVRKITDKGFISAPRRAGADLVVLRDDLQHPAELFRVSPQGGEPQPISAVNRERMAHIRTGEATQFSFPGWRRETVSGWVVKPVDYEPGKRYPVAYLIHGGPQGSFGDHFHYRWNPQTYAGAGYATVMIDFHGSTGYGQAFTDSISGDWGGKPLDDLKLGLAAALEQFDFLDGDRVCALGASYGGYMINWIAGKWSDRFKCLVNHDGVFDHRMMYFSTEELWFAEWEQKGPYWGNTGAHERDNPAAHVSAWKTPMMVIHGSLDYRIPETQGLAAFTALQRQGIPSKLVIFPDENHWVLAPANSEQWHDEVLGWLDTWLTESPESPESPE